MTSPRYAPVSELRDRLGVTDNDRDLALGRCLDAASRWIDRETRRRFYVVPETRFYTASRSGSSRALAIDDAVTVTAVATDDDGNGAYETSWTVGTDYWLGPRNAPLDGKPYRSINCNYNGGRYRWPCWDGAISVTGDFGYSATVPDTIRELAFMVAEVLARPVLDLTIAGVQSYTLGTDLTVAMKPEELPPAAKQIIGLFADPFQFA